VAVTKHSIQTLNRTSGERSYGLQPPCSPDIILYNLLLLGYLRTQPLKQIHTKKNLKQTQLAVPCISKELWCVGKISLEDMENVSEPIGNIFSTCCKVSEFHYAKILQWHYYHGWPCRKCGNQQSDCAYQKDCASEELPNLIVLHRTVVSRAHLFQYPKIFYLKFILKHSKICYTCQEWSLWCYTVIF
jgi:hypothetical protein